MQNWKKALVFGALGTGAVLILTGRRNVGIATVAGGLAVLASEYPERFEAVLADAPEYFGRAAQIFGTLTRMGEKFAENTEQISTQSEAEFV